VSETPPQARPGTVELLQRAAALEACGAWADAIGVWSSAVARDPSFLPAQLGLAQALIRAGKPADALPILEHVTVRAPGLAGAWLALGVAQSMLGRHGDALASAERAVSISPNVAGAHLGHGDILYRTGNYAGAGRAYQRAVVLAPGDPDALNKLATIARSEGRRDDAEALLAQALARAPDHPYARLNQATLAIQRSGPDEGRRLLESMLARGSVPADVRDNAGNTLAMIVERERLSAPVAASLEANDRGPIEAALRSMPSPDTVDPRTADALARVVENALRESPVDALFAPGPARASAWPAIEAHHTYRHDAHPIALARSVRLVAGVETPTSPEDVDVVRCARVVAGHAASSPDLRDGIAHDAWLRWTHARLVGHRPELWPGFLNPITSVPRGDAELAGPSSHAITGTLRMAFGNLASRLPPGGWRATVGFLAILWIHPFLNANKRMARIVANRELAAAGLMPHVNLPGANREFAAISHQVRRTGDAWPFAEWLARESGRAARLDASWAENERNRPPA
jgi:Flp pilus assembly protein TadD